MATDDSNVITCSNPDCSVATTGKCANNQDLAECPHYGTETENSEVAEIEVGPATVTFASGQKLSMREATRLLRRRRSQVVAIIGPYDSGKTSLVASLYDLFQEGPVGEVEFADSTTLHALEFASHHSRIESGRTSPDSERTPLGKAGFYHLDVRGNGAADITTVLLGDRAGEEYRAAADDVDLSTEFAEISRADSLSLLVDGERLVDSETRHNVLSQIEGMLRAFAEAGVTVRTQRIALVLTKLDAVEESSHSARAHADVEKLLSKLRTRYGDQFAAIELFKVAAAPKGESVKRGTGVGELLSFWLIPRGHEFPAQDAHDLPTRAIGRLSIVPG